MRYFAQLAEGIDPAALLKVIQAHPELWGEIKLREQYVGSAHADTESIYIKAPLTVDNLFDNLDSVLFAAAEVLSPQILLMMELFHSILDVREWGRIMLVRLKAGGKITAHLDEGAYARYFARFHYVLESSPGCLFSCGDERVHMPVGSLWWFNHQVQHQVENDGPDRIHLIFDATAPGFTGALGALHA